MIVFVSKLLIEWLDIDEILRLGLSKSRPNARLFEPLRFHAKGDCYEVPAGDITDFASIPKIFWSILSPTDPRYAYEAVFHDRGYRSGGYYILSGTGQLIKLGDRAEIDRLFLAAIKAKDKAHEGTANNLSGKIKILGKRARNFAGRTAIYTAVRLFGWLSWQGENKPERTIMKIGLLIIIIASIASISGCGAVKEYRENYERSYGAFYSDGEKSIGGNITLKPRGYAK